LHSAQARLGSEVLIQIESNCTEPSGESSKDAFKGTRPPHDPLFGIANCSEQEVRAFKGRADQCELRVGAVLKLIEKNVRICLPHGISSNITVLQNLHSERDKVAIGDLTMAVTHVTDCEVGI
jgi:hypothetical protein